MHDFEAYCPYCSNARFMSIAITIIFGVNSIFMDIGFQ